ncbi:LuxR C-terminal-related transcriptional regulator [Amycolatopsis sp. PS_44_ISF1]|uniref:LuxR C-terminal-related transcriptional regulator n=1 Tax=Amycolatopsis sp. PS_44_ISF1 TaxID=2974917 RepID=UPI0028DD5EF0|nr:LuxR C-terminal-related transcriptional regulator [Amycolatopsis sp. PS_44_ISF1]MDT8911867.1 LuxR C-terminal-related transcriptional regulator [Amycolatopsis sp. PS_44_ISF1]
MIECDAGTGETVLVGGGPASGKSQVQNQVVARARELGILTLTAAGAADEREVDGGVIDQLLAGPALPRAVTGPLTEGDPDERIAGLASAVHRLARERAVLVAVDDLHHVDETSARLLLRLQRRTRSSALLLVLNHPDSWYTGDGLRFAAQPHRHVQLTPLSVAAIAELVADAGPEDLPERIHRLTAGNPLLVNALLDAYRGDADDSRVGLAYSEAVQRLLQRYGSPLREVATAIAVLDTEVTTEAVATVAGVDPLEAEASAGVLADSGLVTGVRFRQPPAAAAVVGGLRGPEKVRLHLRAAEVKHHRGLAAADVARHLVAAGEAGAEWALPVLVEAAEQVMLGDDVDFATRCLKLAATATTAKWEQQLISQLLAKITWRVNPAAAAPHLEGLRQGGEQFDRSDRIALVRQSLWFGDRETFERGFAALRDDPAGFEPLDPRTAAELSLAGQWHYGVCAVPPPVPGERPAEAGDPWRHTASTLGAVWRTGGTEATSACAERILQNCRLSDTSLEALATAILALAYDGKTERAEGWCTSLGEEAEYRGAVTWKAMLDAIGAGLTLRRGDVAAAAEQAARALARLDAPNWGVAISYPLATLLSAHTAAGAFKAAAAVLRHPVPDVVFTTLGGVRYLRARGQFHLATNRGLAAVSDFQQCRRILRERGLDLPVVAPWRSDLAEANLRLGNPTLAVELTRHQLTDAVPTDSYSRGSALRVLAFAGDSAARPGLLNRAAEAFKASGDRLELAKTVRALNQLGQRAERSAGLVKPVHVPRQAGPAGSRAPAPGRMASTVAGSTAGVSTMDGLRPRPGAAAKPGGAAHPASLSEAELRVAELAAHGRTNRQIAETLYITVSTVEQHLTRVYRKLGVSGRSALAGGLADEPAGGADGA